jgi:superfamily II DNA or RNA helicase
MTKEVLMVKTGNFLLVDSVSNDVREIAKRALTYQRRSFNRPEVRRWSAQREGKSLPPIEVEDVPVYELDRDGKIACMFGYYSRLWQELRQHGYTAKIAVHDKKSPVYLPDWDNLATFDFEFRAGQRELLEKIAASRCGRIDCATGYGKSFVIAAICALFPKASIDIVCKSVSVVRERLHPELVMLFGDVGLVGGGSLKRAPRINCYTADSMHKSPGTSDFLLGDEIHQLATERLVGGMLNWKNSHNFGFTASMNVRFDNCDFLLEGIFGPLIFRFDYQSSVSAGAVVPIKVLWNKVEMSYNPADGARDESSKMRNAVWRNNVRNSMIAADARRYDDDEQVLITCATLEHALALHKHLPEFTTVYREPTDMRRIRSLQAQGLWDPNAPAMTLQHRSHLAKQFETGELKKAICTTVWNVGVSFNKLSVLIRADGTASAVNDIQIPGRTSRLADGKEFAIVHDYEDVFDRGFKQRSGRRRANYQRQGWEQINL